MSDSGSGSGSSPTQDDDKAKWYRKQLQELTPEEYKKMARDTAPPKPGEHESNYNVGPYVVADELIPSIIPKEIDSAERAAEFRGQGHRWRYYSNRMAGKLIVFQKKYKNSKEVHFWAVSIYVEQFALISQTLWMPFAVETPDGDEIILMDIFTMQSFGGYRVRTFPLGSRMHGLVIIEPRVPGDPRFDEQLAKKLHQQSTITPAQHIELVHMNARAMRKSLKSHYLPVVLGRFEKDNNMPAQEFVNSTSRTVDEANSRVPNEPVDFYVLKKGAAD